MHNGWISKEQAARVSYGMARIRLHDLLDEVRAKWGDCETYRAWRNEVFSMTDPTQAIEAAEAKLAELQNPLALVANQAGYEITEDENG
jgi:hypothetical protein